MLLEMISKRSLIDDKATANKDNNIKMRRTRNGGKEDEEDDSGSRTSSYLQLPQSRVAICWSQQ